MADDYGTFTTYQEATRNDQVAVSTSSITACVARQGGDKRKVVLIRNTSPNAADTIWLNFGAQPAVVGKGIKLAQNEGVQDSADGQYLPWQGTVTAICETVNGTLAIFER